MRPDVYRSDVYRFDVYRSDVDKQRQQCCADFGTPHGPKVKCPVKLITE
jgi:hypothetical protein